MSWLRTSLALFGLALVGATAGAGHGAAGCHAKGGLQDSACTPGARFAGVTAADVCRPGYAGSVRNVPESMKRAVYARYGIAGSHHGSAFEVDHLISLELGGSNVIENLWPEAAAPLPGFHQKDKLENALHREVCAGTSTLARAQQLIRRNWLAAYRNLGL
jgi:hypothetical protein